MLEHLSPKFKMPPTEREPRAALILNRFTRTLTIMFATNAVSSILGVSPEQLRGKSLYECIAENCLADAIKCLESAKANDSIAYLRFWSRDPRTDEGLEEDEDDVAMGNLEDEALDRDNYDSDGGVRLNDTNDAGSDSTPDTPIKSEASSDLNVLRALTMDGSSSQHRSSATLGDQAQIQPANRPAPQRPVPQQRLRAPRPERLPTRELEAVVSCTSDGLVMVLRKARPLIPTLHPPLLAADLENGLFAAPWSEQPVRPYYPPDLFHNFRPPFLPQYMPLQDHVKEVGGPPIDQLMKSIRDVAVFAWGLVGINGNLASYGHGKPRDEAQPPGGLPIWDPNAPKTSYLGPEPPSSRLRRNNLTDECSARPNLPGHSVYSSGPTTGVGQSHTHTHSRFDNMGFSHSSSLIRPDSSIIPPFSGGGACPPVQQQPQYNVSDHQSSMTVQARLADGIGTEALSSHDRSNVDEPQIPTTQGYDAGNTQHDFRYMWR